LNKHNHAFLQENKTFLRVLKTAIFGIISGQVLIPTKQHLNGKAEA